MEYMQIPPRLHAALSIEDAAERAALFIKCGIDPVDPAAYPDPARPLAHDVPDARISTAIHRRITANIAAAMERNRARFADIAAAIPRRDGSGSISPRQAANLARRYPERMTQDQADALAAFLGCSLDYMRGVVASPDYRTDRGSAAQIATIYANLDADAQGTLWSVARSLLAAHDAELLAILDANAGSPARSLDEIEEALARHAAEPSDGIPR